MCITHTIILQESSNDSERLNWLVETHLKPLYDLVVEPLSRLQQLGIAPAGDPAMLYNMIRVSAGGLLALALEIKGTTGVDLEDKSQRDELAEMIIRVFFAGDLPARD